MSDAEWMRSLLRRVPVHAVDLRAVQAAGDATALSYHRAMQEWLREASLALHEAEMDGPGPRHGGASQIEGHRGSGPLGNRIAELVSTDRSAGLAG